MMEMDGIEMDGCLICGEPRHERAYACPRCKKIIDRFDSRRDAAGRPRRFDRQARIRALQAAWDRDVKVFRCHYTGIELDTGDRYDHRYLSLEHRTPGDESDITVVAALINRMKTDLSDAEFRRLINALAAHFDGQDFDENAFPDRRFKAPDRPASAAP